MKGSKFLDYLFGKTELQRVQFSSSFRRSWLDIICHRRNRHPVFQKLFRKERAFFIWRSIRWIHWLDAIYFSNEPIRCLKMVFSNESCRLLTVFWQFKSSKNSGGVASRYSLLIHWRLARKEYFCQVPPLLISLNPELGCRQKKPKPLHDMRCCLARRETFSCQRWRVVTSRQYIHQYLFTAFRCCSDRRLHILKRIFTWVSSTDTKPTTAKCDYIYLRCLSSVYSLING